MQIGVTFPQLEIGTDAGVIRAYAQAVEGLGFAHLAAYDHVLGADHERDDPRTAAWPAAAYSERDAFHEPLVLFGFLAAVTSELVLATGILILPQRQTALVAKQAAEVDLLSGGRLRLGVGVGWNHLEYEALAIPWERRGRRMVEQIELLRALWRQPIVDFAGEFDTIPRMAIEPRPARSIPVWMGAQTPIGLRRAVRHCDGVMASWPATHPQLDRWIADLDAALAAAGRERSTFSVEGRVNLYERDEDEIAADVRRWAELGASHLSLNAMAPPELRDRPWSIDRQIEALERFRAVVPGGGA
jgi:probable F420-dependent oxidoreductase